MSKLPAVLQQLKFPVIASPLFIISNPKLVIAQCKAGVVGSMPALNARPAEQLEEWLIEITEVARRPQPRASRQTSGTVSPLTKSCTRAMTGLNTTWPCV
jgi:NAD(P)H-dependent flavin oxidoreductase YrpB (nitropropane dioxygenase family)